MNFREIKIEAEELLKLWGFANTQPTPDISTLCNRAYKNIVWEAEALKSDSVITTIVDQKDYILPDYEWKSITDAYLDNLVLEHTTEENVREEDIYWLFSPSTKPRKWWWVDNSTIRLYPTPDDVYTVTMRGTHSPPEMVLDDDIPKIPEAYHDAIPLGAAYYHIRKYAKGEAQILQRNTLSSEFMEKTVALKDHLNTNRMVAQRRKNEKYGVFI